MIVRSFEIGHIIFDYGNPTTHSSSYTVIKGELEAKIANLSVSNSKPHAAEEERPIEYCQILKFD
jgi:hypothetical protein